jgi:hypothetical protein
MQIQAHTNPLCPKVAARGCAKSKTKGGSQVVRQFLALYAFFPANPQANVLTTEFIVLTTERFLLGLARTVYIRYYWQENHQI